MAADDKLACEQLSTKMEILLTCVQLVGSEEEFIAGKASKFLRLQKGGKIRFKIYKRWSSKE